MLKHSKILRDRLAIISVAGAFAFAPLVISPVMAQTLGAESDDAYTIESDASTLEEEAAQPEQETPDETAVEENQVEPYSDKMATEEPAPTEGNPVTAEDSPAVDSDALAVDDDASIGDSLATDENMPADDSVAGDTELQTETGVDPMTSASIPDSEGEDGLYVLEQSDDQVMANRYIGKAVYNDAMEKVGDIRDLVFTVDGGIEAAVIGVGGFLGLGQKQVAVRFEEIRIVENPETAELELYLSANAEQLAEAPEFTTKEDKLAASRTQAPDAGGAASPVAPAEPMTPVEPTTPPAE